MLSNKPYLIRAFYDWIVDSKCTPLIVADTNFAECRVPTEFIENGEILLNVAPQAIRDLKITASQVQFSASFGGVGHIIIVPIRAILAIYAEENGQGMYFDLNDEGQDSEGGIEQTIIEDDSHLTVKSKSHLKLVE